MQRYISINHSIGGIPEMYFTVTFPEQQFQLLNTVMDKQPISVDELAKHVHNIVLMVH